MNNILITGTGGCGVGEGIYKSLKPLKKYNVFACNNSDNSLYLFDELEKSFIVPNADHEHYSDILIEICQKHNIQTIIPGSEQELVVLVNNREKLSNNNLTIFANTSEVIKTFDNKWETYLKLKSLNINTPETTLDVCDAKFFENNSFPMIIKPVYGNASKNVFIINSKEELKCISDYLNLKEIPFVIQEHVGTAKEEYTISVLSDLSGNYLGSIILKRILAGGFSQFVECERFEKLDQIAKKIALSINSKGPLNIQCRMMNDILYVFEINPRFSGTSPFRTLLGFNEVDILYRKVYENINIFNENKILYGSFGVRGFQEKIYNNQTKFKVNRN